MRILLDSNVLVSAALFKTESMSRFIGKIKNDCTIVLTDLIIAEASGVIERKFPQKVAAFTEFLSELSFEYFETVDTAGQDGYDIRDETDKRILHSAYSAAVDILVTGDKDFFDRVYAGLEIITPSDFVKKY